MLRLQAVDRDDDLQPRNPGPLRGNRPDRARHELGVDAAFRQTRQDLLQLAIAHQRLAADDRHVQRLVLVDERQEPIDELLTLVVADLSERDVAAEMLVAVGVASRAAQRALAGDFDRQGGR